jgi:2-iminobutanoate/2-iminopropanoate deaminase
VTNRDLAFVSGQIPLEPGGSLVPGGIAEQVHAVLRNVDRCLSAAGSGLDDVVKVVAYLTDRGDFATFNEVYASYFREPRPVRTTILCGLMDERFLVEVDVVAIRPA